MSWSRNWPRNVTPAVDAGLSRLLGLSSGFVINRTGPSASGSFASSGPPGAPNSSSACWTAAFASANGGRLKMRVKRSVRVGVTVTFSICASVPSCASAPAGAMIAPAPIPLRNFRRVTALASFSLDLSPGLSWTHLLRHAPREELIWLGDGAATAAQGCDHASQLMWALRLEGDRLRRGDRLSGIRTRRWSRNYVAKTVAPCGSDPT